LFLGAVIVARSREKVGNSSTCEFSLSKQCSALTSSTKYTRFQVAIMKPSLSRYK
jgi:hypothetical protein